MKSSVRIALLLALWSLGLLAQTPSKTGTALQVKRFVAPAYPAAARKGRMQGTTASELQVRPDGTVDSVKVVMAHPVFQEYVEAALKQWVFEPVPRLTTLKVTVRFWLDGCGEPAPNQTREQLFGETLVQADLPDLVEIRTCLEPVITTTN